VLETNIFGGLPLFADSRYNEDCGVFGFLQKMGLARNLSGAVLQFTRLIMGGE
jgi:hypothetical protein